MARETYTIPARDFASTRSAILRAGGFITRSAPTALGGQDGYVVTVAWRS